MMMAMLDNASLQGNDVLRMKNNGTLVISSTLAWRFYVPLLAPCLLVTGEMTGCQCERAAFLASAQSNGANKYINCDFCVRLQRVVVALCCS